MGLFSSLFKQTPTVLEFKPKTIQEAYFSVLYPVVRADGDFGDEEMNNFVAILMKTGIFGDTDLTDLTIAANQNLERFGAKVMIEAGLKLVNIKYKPQLFCYCAELILADGVVTSEEEQILEYLATLAELPEEMSKKIIEVMMIRAGISV